MSWAVMMSYNHQLLFHMNEELIEITMLTCKCAYRKSLKQINSHLHHHSPKCSKNDNPHCLMANLSLAWYDFY